jgi:5-methyltetrahydrofolate--homocysteine methyltransferase
MLKEIYENVIAGDVKTVETKVQAALDAGENPSEILNQAMISAMQEVGRRFENDECFVPEMLIAARAMQTGLGVLRPHLIAADIQPKGKIVLGTVKGDLHDIGKNLVGMMLEGAGFDLIDLGTDTDSAKFVAAIKEHEPDMVCMSCLLTTTMANMEQIIQAFKEAGVRSQVKVMVGGAPVTNTFAKEIGADLYAANSAAAANVALEAMAVA